MLYLFIRNAVDNYTFTRTTFRLEEAHFFYDQVRPWKHVRTRAYKQLTDTLSFWLRDHFWSQLPIFSSKCNPPGGIMCTTSISKGLFRDKLIWWGVAGNGDYADLIISFRHRQNSSIAKSLIEHYPEVHTVVNMNSLCLQSTQCTKGLARSVSGGAYYGSECV